MTWLLDGQRENTEKSAADHVAERIADAVRQYSGKIGESENIAGLLEELAGKIWEAHCKLLTEGLGVLSANTEREIEYYAECRLRNAPSRLESRLSVLRELRGLLDFTKSQGSRAKGCV